MAGLVAFWQLWGGVMENPLVQAGGLHSLKSPPPPPALKGDLLSLLISLPICGMERKMDEGGLEDMNSQISKTESDSFLQLPSYLSFLLLFLVVVLGLILCHINL